MICHTIKYHETIGKHLLICENDLERLDMIGKDQKRSENIGTLI